MGLTVYGGGGKPEEEKTVIAGTSVIEVSPSSGKVIKKVTVNPTPTESKSVTPTTSELTVTPSEGKHLSQVVVGAVEDVTPEVTAQTPVITQIAENLGVTLTTPSGTNKQILQGNNANLLNIKNNAKKEGLYVWKKSKKYTISFTQEGTTGVYQCTSDDIDLSTVDDNWFVGTSGVITTSSNTPYEFQENNVFKGTSSGLTYSYNPTTQKMTISYASAGTRTMSDGVNKIFIDYVVSDDSSAYPDGAEQDGYWYEIVVEGFDLSRLGFSKYAVDTYVSSTRRSLKSRTVPHSLGEKPDFALIITSDGSQVTTVGDIYYASWRTIGDLSSFGITSLTVGLDRSDSTATILQFGNDSGLASRYFVAGLEYTVITGKF